MNYFDPNTFYFDLPIYTPLTITEDNHDQFLSLLDSDDPVNAYNPTLRENTTYSVSPCRNRDADYFSNFGGVNTFQLTCVRTKEYFWIYVHYDIQKNIFQKIGQFPSIADFHISQIKKYDRVLSNDRLKEFTRAIGLAANGVGIGSFVYLRRIFEQLIEEAHNEAKSDSDWDEVIYLKQRMSERIEILRNHLPFFLVENKSLYGILSIGIHSLNEGECLAYFETVKVGIELILDEKLEKFNKQKKIEEAKQKLAALTQKINK